jgi:chromatin remodeling complex protein RSC6
MHVVISDINLLLLFPSYQSLNSDLTGHHPLMAHLINTTYYTHSCTTYGFTTKLNKQNMHKQVPNKTLETKSQNSILFFPKTTQKCWFRASLIPL